MRRTSAMDAAQGMMLAEFESVLERVRQRLLEQPPTPTSSAGRESERLVRRLQEIRTTFDRCRPAPAPRRYKQSRPAIICGMYEDPGAAKAPESADDKGKGTQAARGRRIEIRP